MKRVRRILSVVVAAGMILGTPSSGLWATSAVPEPGVFGIPINPNASGTKVSGPLSVGFELEETAFCDGTLLVLNMFVVTTLQQGNNIRPFARDFSRIAPTPTPGLGTPPDGTICFGDQPAQINYVFQLISQQVIPFFFACQASVNCPGFEVKSITNFLSSGGTGAMSMNITLAVH